MNRVTLEMRIKNVAIETQRVCYAVQNREIKPSKVITLWLNFKPWTNFHA